MDKYFTNNTISHKGKFYTGMLPEEVIQALGSRLPNYIANGSVIKLMTQVDSPLDTTIIPPQEEKKTHVVINEGKMPEETIKINKFKQLQDKVKEVAKENNISDEEIKPYLKSIKSCQDFLDDLKIVY